MRHRSRFIALPAFIGDNVQNVGGLGIMATIRGFWQHTNGKVYAVESDTFGKILGAAGPLDLNDLRDLDEYDYRPAITGWVANAVARQALRRINPSPCGR